MLLEIKLSGLTDGFYEAEVGNAIEEGVSEAGALILNRIRRRFLAQESPDGVPWEPSLAAFQRSFSGRGGGTLFDTGTLFHSIQLFSISPLEKSIATDVAYAPKHQYGEGGLPVREFLGFSDEDSTLARLVLLKKINEAFK